MVKYTVWSPWGQFTLNDKECQSEIFFDDSLMFATFQCKYKRASIIKKNLLCVVMSFSDSLSVGVNQLKCFVVQLTKPIHNPYMPKRPPQDENSREHYITTRELDFLQHDGGRYNSFTISLSIYLLLLTEALLLQTQ